MSNKKTKTLVLRGTLQYAKILGDPSLNYNKDGQEWKFDFVPNNQKSVNKELKEAGIADRLRVLIDKKTNTPRYGGSAYMTFKQNANRKDGTPNQPIKVVDAAGNPWNPTTLLGNDTEADVKFVVIDNGEGKFTGVYPRAVRVLKLVPYQAKEFEPLDEDDEFHEEAMEAAQEEVFIPVDDDNDVEVEDDDLPM